MKLYRTNSFIKIAWKFTIPKSMMCGHCLTPLNVIDVVDNPKHHFNPGQLFSCVCRKSKIWANSIRFPEDLIKYCDGKEVLQFRNPEVYGFCCDMYCPYCWNFLNVLKNDKEINGRLYDVYGCGRCLQNRNIIHSGINLGEIEGQKYLANWYRDNQSMWRDKIHE